MVPRWYPSLPFRNPRVFSLSRKWGAPPAPLAVTSSSVDAAAPATCTPPAPVPVKSSSTTDAAPVTLAALVDPTPITVASSSVVDVVPITTATPAPEAVISSIVVVAAPAMGAVPALAPVKSSSEAGIRTQIKKPSFGRCGPQGALAVARAYAGFATLIELAASATAEIKMPGCRSD